MPQKCPSFKYAPDLLLEVLSTWEDAEEVMPHFSGAFDIPGGDRRELPVFPCSILSTAVICFSIGEQKEFGCNLCVAQTRQCSQVVVIKCYFSFS